MGVCEALRNFFAPEQRQSHEGNRRDRWNSRSAYIFAAIGAAVGLGNIWRFPALSYKFGGGAFLLPYLLALFLVGIPILILEAALGQVYQSGDIISFSSINRRLGGIGLASITGSFFVVCYYVVIIAWSCLYFIDSFKSPLPWAGTNAISALQGSSSYFYEDVLALPDSGDSLGTFRPAIYGAVIFVWALVVLCTSRGVSFTGNIVYITVPLPVILIIALLARGITLPGAEDGIELYIGKWDWTALQDPTIWAEATAQIFFSIGITFGIMTAYSSYKPREQDTVLDACIIAVSNSGVSVVAGFAVFSILGYLAQESGQDISDLEVGGISLAFVTYPVALSLLPLPNFWSALFFATLFTLGLDSAFGLVEACTTALKDSKTFHKVSHLKMTACVAVVALAIGCLFSFDIGLYILDVVDYFVNNLAMLFVGLCEVTAAGWLYNVNEQKEQIGAKAVWLHAFTMILSTFAAILATVFVDRDMLGGYTPVILAAPLFVVVYAIGAAIALKIADEPHSRESKKYHLFLHNPEKLREELNTHITSGGNHMSIPFVWSLLMKYVLPPMLVILLSVNIHNLASNSGYGGYNPTYQLIGGLVCGIPGLMVLFFAVFPGPMEAFLPPEGESMKYNKNEQGIFGSDYATPAQAHTVTVKRPPSSGDPGVDESKAGVFD
ncbi:unnamed protein product [Chrysoparadoxa australica]